MNAVSLTGSGYRRLLPAISLACMALCCSCTSLTVSRIEAPARIPVDPARIDARIAELLSKPLGPDEAAELALLRSPALASNLSIIGIDPAQRLLVAHTGPSSRKNGAAPVNSDPRIGRTLTVNLSSWLADRLQASANDAAKAAALAVGDRVFSVRRTWIHAVAARQHVTYQADVVEAAEAAQLLSQRRQQVGNAARLENLSAHRLLEQAKANLAHGRLQALLQRERLQHQIGLWGVDAERMQLPPRLPELPPAPAGAEGLEALAVSERLDMQMARAAILRHDANDAEGRHAELEDVAISARHQVRTAWLAYRANWDRARHACGPGLALARAILEEQVKRYNGMQMGASDLLAESRLQTDAVLSCISRQAEFWLAETDLQQALAGMGAPAPVGITATPALPLPHPGGH
ncbi:hypothetical protein SAMN06265795_103351 [Noviherbaspirillum humi]|uniref:Outer membrane protein TolC n=1 Tax=Noviherbaspirillum humi TaxID=1688639 RepID=A0A239FGL0_9BURK|nr:hypothetical protein [Noviherbaspirillum humi]SNS56059.1 hypothetical protein SAMN06265795_103351 [Noviherbaspirillum humi]